MTSTFVLGIDGGTWRALEAFDLPALNRLTDDGVSGTLRSTYPPITFPAWKCLSTGKNPGNLGVFGFSNFDREQKENRQNDATHFDSAELWDYVGDEGGRVGVVNMPTTYPPYDVNGVMIAGPNAGESDYVRPASRETEIEESGYEPLTSGYRLAFKAGGQKAVSGATDIIESRFEVSRRLIRDGDYDFFDLTLYCTDTIQHYYWMEEEMRAVFDVVDRELNELLDLLDRDDEAWNVVIVSDHGFQPIQGALYLDTWLEREGFLTQQDGDDGSSVKRSLGLTTDNAYKLIERLNLEGLIERLSDSLVKRVGSGLAAGSGLSVVESVNWERSDAVFLHGGIYILDDHRRNSIVEDLERALTQATDERGERIFSEVRRREEIYDGPYEAAAPDLVPVSDEYKLLGLADDGSLFDPDDDWIASHEMDGVFLANGPDFGSAEEVSLDLYDVAPTLLHAMGYGVPEDVDGEVRSEILETSEDERWRDPLSSRPETELTAADRERMNERLQELGYVG